MEHWTAMPSSGQWRATLPYLGLMALAALLRLARLDSYPPITADEGGWPLAVREWVEAGTRTSDYFMAPGYHWLLGIPFKLFGAVLSVARPVSAIVSLLSLFLFHRLATRLAGHRTALWATLLLGTCYPAVLLDRRALIEPFQVALMLGLALAVAEAWERHSVARWAGAAAITALLLLTKASAVYLLPALTVAAVWRPEGTVLRQWRKPLWTMGALGAGAMAAAAVFAAMYWQDPAGFLAEWSQDMSTSNVPGVAASGKGGRFALNPVSAETTMRWFAGYEPVLFGCSVLGLLKALAERRQPLMTAWYLFGMAFLFVQLYVQENHRATVIPPMCFMAGWLLCELHEEITAAAAAAGRGRRRLSWALAALAVLSGYGAARLAAGVARATQPDAAALAYVKTHAAPNARVMAAPYVAMRLASPPLAFWKLGSPYAPTPAAIHRAGVEWLIVDAKEWRFHHDADSGNPAALDAALNACCELAFSEGGGPSATRVYRVRTATQASSHP